MEFTYIITKEEVQDVKQEENCGFLFCELPIIKEDITIEKEVFQNGITTKFTDYTDLLMEAPRLCIICDKVFQNSFTFLQHNMTHLKVKINKMRLIPCQRCEENFFTTLDLENHIKTKHLKLKQCENRLEKCHICNKVFSRKYWHSHLKDVHAASNYACSICNDGTVLKNATNLKRHIKYVHEKKERAPWRFRKTNGYREGEFKCNLCPKVFFNRGSIKTHIRNCHSGCTAQCDMCGSVLKNKSYLVTHLRRVHYDDGKLHACDICGKTFKSPRRVRLHKQNSHKL